mmetsp:Transcript_102224/g.153136  ORF Transcript_102224/g.153136 Transcript_102224/m.153136 type:complete len:310 (-) Transcript_102224:295-1224(-)
MENLGSKVGQFQGFVVFQRSNRKGLGDTTWISGVDSISIFPHGDTSGGHQPGKDGCRIIRSRSLKSCRYTFCSRGDETGSNQNRHGLLIIQIQKTLGAAIRIPPCLETSASLRPKGANASRGSATLFSQSGAVRFDNENVTGVHPVTRNSCRFQIGVERLGTPNLTISGDDFHCHGRNGTKHAQRLYDTTNILGVLSKVGFDGVCNFRCSQFLQERNLSFNGLVQRVVGFLKIYQGGIHYLDEEIGHTSTSRYNRHSRNGALSTSSRFLDEQIAHRTIELCRCQRGSSELVDFPLTSLIVLNTIEFGVR